MKKIRFKICCISGIEEAELAVNYGASALGLVSAMPSGPGVIDESLILKIAETIPPGIASVLLTSKTSVDDIIEQQKKLGTNTIQICDKITGGHLSDFKKALPGISIIQVVHVTGDESIREAIEASNFVNAILLDSGNQNLKVKELGGTGRVHDWQLSKKIVESVNVPVFLAGGLNPANAADAVDLVKPYALDVCSGVRTSGNLDEKKLAQFVSVIDKINNLN